jgi:hypothetical protein
MPESRAATKPNKSWRSSFVLRVAGDASNLKIELFDLRTGHKLEFGSFQTLNAYLERHYQYRGLH